MALGLPTFCVFLVLMRCYQAMQDTKTMCLVYLVENGANVVLDLALYPRFGIRGLAAGLALGYLAGAVVAGVNISRRLDGLGGTRLAAAIGAVVTAGAAAAAGAWVVSWSIGQLPGGTRQLAVAARVIAGVLAGVTVYFLTARAVGFDEVRKLLQLRKRPA
jgi:putative peptidoglycan lipid II flippase